MRAHQDRGCLDKLTMSSQLDKPYSRASHLRGSKLLSTIFLNLSRIRNTIEVNYKPGFRKYRDVQSRRLVHYELQTALKKNEDPLTSTSRISWSQHDSNENASAPDLKVTLATVCVAVAKTSNINGKAAIETTPRKWLMQKHHGNPKQTEIGVLVIQHKKSRFHKPLFS